MDYEAIGDKILVKLPEKREETTSSGLVVPATSQPDANEGIVVSKGQGRLMSDGKIVPLGVNVGDLVVFSRQMCVELNLEGTPHVVLRESDVLAVKKC